MLIYDRVRIAICKNLKLKKKEAKKEETKNKNKNKNKNKKNLHDIFSLHVYLCFTPDPEAPHFDGTHHKYPRMQYDIVYKLHIQTKTM